MAGSFISVPKEALAELLRSSGSTLTPEQFLASLPDTAVNRKYAGRARVAAWSRNVLVGVTILAALCVPLNLDSVGGFVENLIILVVLAVITYFEDRVFHLFRDGDPAAPELGFRNESCLAAAILVYGLYHAIVPSQVTSELRDLVDPSLLSSIQSLVRVSYIFVGVIGSLSQFGLAWYYRGARDAAC